MTTIQEIKSLAIQLQNATYNHGYVDNTEYGSDAKYEKAYQKSLDALNHLLAKCEQLNEYVEHLEKYV